MKVLIDSIKSGRFLKDRRMRTILLALAFTLVFCVFITATLFAGSSYVPEDTVQDLNYERSQVYVDGTGYVLDSYTKKQHEEEEEERSLIQQEEPKEKEDKEDKKDDTTDPLRRYNNSSLYNRPSYSRPTYSTPSRRTTPSNDGDNKKEKKEKDNGYNKKKSEESTVVKPTIKVSGVKNGDTVNGEILKFKVTATSYDGDEITGSKLVVKMNGTKLPASGSSYTGDVVDGNNEITIKAEDGEGNKKSKTIKFTGETEAEPEEAGDVDITVSADVLGLGDILDGTITFKKNESVKDAVDACLKENGAKGKWSGGYLSSIQMDGILDGIPDDVIQDLEEQGISIPDNKDSLGEFDFGSESGWKYTIDGKEPKKMMSEVDPEDGSKIEIFYTLNM